MPSSFTKKGLNFVKEVYALAKEPDRLQAQLQGQFQGQSQSQPSLQSPSYIPPRSPNLSQQYAQPVQYYPPVQTYQSSSPSPQYQQPLPQWQDSQPQPYYGQGQVSSYSAPPYLSPPLSMQPSYNTWTQPMQPTPSVSPPNPNQGAWQMNQHAAVPHHGPYASPPPPLPARHSFSTPSPQPSPQQDWRPPLPARSSVSTPSHNPSPSPGPPQHQRPYPQPFVNTSGQSFDNYAQHAYQQSPPPNSANSGRSQSIPSLAVSPPGSDMVSHLPGSQYPNILPPAHALNTQVFELADASYNSPHYPATPTSPPANVATKPMSNSPPTSMSPPSYNPSQYLNNNESTSSGQSFQMHQMTAAVNSISMSSQSQPSPPSAHSSNAEPWPYMRTASAHTTAAVAPQQYSNQSAPSPSAPMLPSSSSPQHRNSQTNLMRTHDILPDAIRVQRGGDNSRPMKILSLDGGGVRGLSSILILEHLMQVLGGMRGAVLQPWQEFDMICGTSTGGLIALMLGRLRMSLAECKEAYLSLSKALFTPVQSQVHIPGKALALLHADGRFHSEPLEEFFKQALRKRQLSETSLLKDDDPDSPKVFVCACEGINSDAVVIRSYKNRQYDDLFGVCKIWEAARATSAASRLFEPITIADRQYVDGALKHNNPIQKADKESRELWPGRDRLIISIGTGSAPGPDVTGDLKSLAKAMNQIVIETEDTNNDFRDNHQDMVHGNRLFRFNVYHGLADVEVQEHKAMGKIAAHTATYMKKYDTAREVEMCANVMRETGQRLGYIAGEELHTHRRIEQLAGVYCEFCEVCHRGIQYNSSLFICAECRVLICGDCHSAHDNAHLRRLIRFRLLQWMPKLPGIEGTASCRNCAKEIKCRWQCDRCNWALCRQCVGKNDQRDAFFKDHERDHPDDRTFVAIYPPYWNTNAKWIINECRCFLTDPPVIFHCDRCHNGIKIGVRIYSCSTCISQFGASQSLCASCYKTENPDHLRTHKWGTLDCCFDPKGVDEFDPDTKLYLSCPLCPGEKILEEQAYAHPHDNFRLYLSPLMLELIQLTNTLTCNREGIKTEKKAARDVTKLNCHVCLNFLCFEQKASVCMSQKCNWTYCGPCTINKRTRHRHPLYEVTITRTPTGAFNSVRCCICSQNYIASIFQGLWCEDCNNYDVCLVCVDKVNKGQLELPAGLPHMKILKQCKARNWLWYINESATG